MPKICYEPRKFSVESLQTIKTANTILEDYAAQGYDLTLRQLYYQFVSRALIENKDSEYKRLGSVINDARLAGLIDWDFITDRTRNMKENGHWDSPRDIIRACGTQFLSDKWANQSNYVEVWVEKDALVGVLEVACKPLDVPYFSCRGYTSQSEMWSAGQRLLAKVRAGKEVTVIHLGDHDPSGIDMSRDIESRLNNFTTYHRLRDWFSQHERKPAENREAWQKRGQGALDHDASANRLYVSPIRVKRVALNMDQIEQYNPPPNPAKLTDSRVTKYIAEYGSQSWELDALEPAVLTTLIQDEVGQLRDDVKWHNDLRKEEVQRAKLEACAARWDSIAATL